MYTTLALQAMLLAYPAPRDREPPDKGPGFVGVTFESAEDGVLLTEVRPDGPAGKAGLRPNDIIRKFSGEAINFNTFAKRIIRIRPGTMVPVEVKRGEEMLTVKLKIGARPEDFPYPLPDLEEKKDEPTLPPVDDPKK